MKEKLVLIGNGMAGMRTIDELLKLSKDRFDITVFGAEPHGNYNRIMLSPVLAGDKKLEEIIIHDLDWYRENNIRLFVGKTITRIDHENHQVLADDGTVAEYDRLIIATGSKPVMPDIPGKELEGVLSFRRINDVKIMMETARTHKNAVIIGGGLLGLEAADGLLKQGMNVTVVHRNTVLMSQQLDQDAANLLRARLEESGMRFLLDYHIEALLGENRVEKVRLKNGQEIDADLVIMAVGVRPNIDLAQASKIPCDRGILVDDNLNTGVPGIYAVGECVQHRDKTFGLVAQLFEQAKVLAHHLVDNSVYNFKSGATSTQLKVTGIQLFSAGDFIGDSSTDSLVYKDYARQIYKKLVVKENRIKGIVLYGDTQDGLWYFSLLKQEQDIGDMRENILFGQQQVETAE